MADAPWTFMPDLPDPKPFRDPAARVDSREGSAAPPTPTTPPPAAPTPTEPPPTATATATLPDARTKDDTTSVVTSARPPIDKADLARRALLGLIGPEAAGERFAEMQAHAETIGDLYGLQIAAIHPILQRRMAASERALQAVQEYKDELQKAQPTPPTFRKPPEVPDLKVRPWLDPEGKSAISMIAQTLSMLAIGVGGLAVGAPKTALRQFRELADSWRQDEQDRAKSNWQTFQATMESMRADNEQALSMYEIAQKQYGNNELAKRAAMIAETQAVGLEDASLVAASMPFDLARQAHEGMLKNTHLIQEQATRLAGVFTRWDKASANLPASPWKALAELHALQSAMNTEKDPERKADMQSRATMLQGAIKDWGTEQTQQKVAAAGLAETSKLLPAWLQQSQYVARFQSRLGKLYGAYKTLDAAGLLPGTPSTLSDWTAWAQRVNPGAWRQKDVQEAIGVINTFLAPQTVGFDRTMLDDKGARFQGAYGTALHTPLMPLREFQGIAKVWTEESDHVKQYLHLQGQWLRTMGQGAGMTIPDFGTEGESGGE